MAYIMAASYHVIGDHERYSGVICGKKETKYHTFRLYNELYTEDFNAYQSKSPPHFFYAIIRKFFSKDGHTCYIIVRPECKQMLYNYMDNRQASGELLESKFSELIKIIRDMKAKGWSISDSFHDAYVTNNRIVFKSVSNIRPIKGPTSSLYGGMTNADIIEANDELWSNLAALYQIFTRTLTFNEALEYVRNKYKDLAIPTIDPPSYYPRRYGKHHYDPMVDSTPVMDFQGSSTWDSNGQEIPPVYDRGLYNGITS
ncbi:hypothetical protein BDF19DRAFT_495363 [Syncephalis fuscata]|nr:hypothetical protein BDF19DRAFT_495363 [Syncephalis fuscata]